MYLTDIQSTNIALSSLHESTNIGLDLEWKPTFIKSVNQNKVALVQIATNNHVFLVHLSALQVVPQSLRDLLENPRLLKAGVGIQADAQKLYRDHAVSLYACIDLSLLARSVDNSRWKGPYTQPISLARLFHAYFHRTLPKGKVRLSNWEATPLSPAQQQYAADDASASLAILTHLLALADAMPKPPSPECYSFDAIRSRFYHRKSDPFGPIRPWVPRNPDYDPGPPPPKPPKITPAEGAPAADTTHVSEQHSNNDRTRPCPAAHTTEPHSLNTVTSTSTADRGNTFRNGNTQSGQPLTQSQGGKSTLRQTHETGLIASDWPNAARNVSAHFAALHAGPSYSNVTAPTVHHGMRNQWRSHQQPTRPGDSSMPESNIGTYANAASRIPAAIHHGNAQPGQSTAQHRRVKGVWRPRRP